MWDICSFIYWTSVIVDEEIDASQTLSDKYEITASSRLA